MSESEASIGGFFRSERKGAKQFSPERLLSQTQYAQKETRFGELEHSDDADYESEEDEVDEDGG